MMQQQISPQEQYVNQQQMGQPIMLCPIQYVYETPMLMPQGQDQQIQQNQTVVFNVQNPPPWIQNRPQPQNQVVYVQQVPNNYQHYVHPNMMQNSIYHPQFNYQVPQTMLAQDNRQFVQIPNLTHYNAAQSQIAQTVQQIKVEEHNEKMPLLTQMLTQRGIANNGRPVNDNVSDAGGANVNNTITGNVNNIGANNVNIIRSNIHNTNVPTNMIRPVMQNQQVQTEISANNKGRPRNSQPQVITINPMQQHQYMPLHQKSDVIVNIARPQAPFMRPDIPQHIRSKLPSSISVKTVYKPILPRPMRPFDVRPQNFYYNPNYVHVPNPEMRNTIMNTDNSIVKQNINLQGETKQTQTDSVSNGPGLQKNRLANIQDKDKTIKKPIVDSNVTIKEKNIPVKIHKDETNLESNSETKIDCKTQPEEKLLRNTVFTQARGLIINDKDIVQSKSPKRTIHDRLHEERVASNTDNYEDPTRIGKKYIKLQVTESTSTVHPVTVDSFTNTAQVDCYTQCNIPKILPTLNSGQRLETEMRIPINEKLPLLNPEQNVDRNLEKSNTNKTDNLFTDKADTAIKVANNKDDENNVRIQSIPKIENTSMFKNRTHNANAINVLTHVLDGYIIQESNVAFPIQKPAMEKEITHTQENDNKATENKTVSADLKTKNLIGAEGTDDDQLPLRLLNKDIKTEEEMEFVVMNKDNPFTKIQKSTVQTWTTNQLATHLAKYEWNETAAKLGDEEIDGESLLLVNKEQLLAIGIGELHADVIATFISAS